MLGRQPWPHLTSGVMGPRVRGAGTTRGGITLRIRRRAVVASECAIAIAASLLIRLLAADRLQLGEYRVNVEIVALFFGLDEFRLLAGGLGGRQQRRAAV